MPMTTTRHRLALAVATALAVGLTHPAGAAAPKPGLHVSDPAGDANGLNGQGFGAPIPSRSTSPATVSGADITGIDFRTVWVGKGKKRKPFGFDVTMKLAAPLQKGVTIVMTMETSVPCGETNVIQVGYGTSSLAVCQTNGGTANDDIGTWSASADGTSITWSIDPVVKAGTTITNIAASTTVFVLGVFDEASSTGVFRYGK